MRYALRWLCSLLFIIQMYLMMAVLALVFFPWAVISRKGALTACQTYCRWVCWTAGWMVGLRTEVRGEPPTDEVMIAAKHQSFLDIIMIFGAVPSGKFIMKRELIYAPLLGWYSLRVGCIPVDRGKRGQAIAKMKADVEKGASDPGQLVIYPQGTRVAPDDKKPYKAGTAILYDQLGQTCVPVATNIGYFWPKRGFLRKPGTAVVEFLDPIPPGRGVKAFMIELEDVIETNSDRLLAEARAQK